MFGGIIILISSLQFGSHFTTGIEQFQINQSINQSIKFYICVPSLARLIRCLDKFILAYVHVGGLISTDASTWDDKAGMLPPLQRPLLDIAAKVDGGPGHHRWVDEAQPLT